MKLFSSVAGDWVYIKLPEPIMLTSAEFFGRPDAPAVRAPGSFKIYGSNDGKNWVVLHDQTSQKLLYTSEYAKVTVNPPVAATKFYQYIGLVVGSLAGTGGEAYVLQLVEWKIYGKSPGPTCKKVQTMSSVT
jgi:hypothetical protein